MILCLIILLCIDQPVFATETTGDETENSGEILAETEVNIEESSDWEYVFENRTDPFKPFIEDKAAIITIPEEEVTLTGMQIFEPGQLKLVGILFSPEKKLAMVEDVTGKGYVLTEGMLIGRYGVVDEINMVQVNIIETREVAGKEVVNPVVMRLKEGE